MNEKDPIVVNYIKTLSQLESSGGKKLLGDDFGQGPTSAGLFHWNNKKKPLTGDMIPSNFKEDAQRFGFNPNDFSLKNQVNVAYARINDEKNVKGLSIEEIDAKWNGAKIVNGKYVHINPQRKKDLVKTAQQFKQTGGSFNNVQDYFGTQTASAAETAPVDNPVQPVDNRNIVEKVGGGAANLFIKPIESGFKTPKNALLGIAGGLGQSLGQKLQGVSDVDVTGNILKSTQQASQQPTITELATGNQVQGRDLTTLKGVGQTAGDLGEAGLNAFGFAASAPKIALKEMLTRGAVKQGLKAGAGYGAGMGVAGELQEGSDWGKASTYGNLAKETAIGTAFGGGLGLLSKGLQKTGEKIMSARGNELGAVGNALRREIGVNPLLDTPESKIALDKLKVDELTKTKDKLFPLIQDTAPQGDKMRQVTNKLTDIGDDSVQLLQKVFAENPLNKQSFTKSGKINLTSQLNHINDIKRGAGQEMTKIANSLSNSGVKLTTTDILKNFNNLTRNGIPSVPSDKLQKVTDTITQIINNPAYSKNGVINFNKLHDIGITGNSKYDSDALESVARQYLGKAVKEAINTGSLAKNLLPEQKQALTAYSKALNTFGKVADTEWLAQNMSKANVSRGRFPWLGDAAGFMSAGATASPASPLGVLAYAGGKGLTGKLTQAASKSKLASTVKSKLPVNSMTDIVGGLQKESSKAISGLDLLTKATKVKNAASKRVQKAVKTIDKAEKKALPVIQIGKTTASKTKKKVSDGIKAASKKVKLPTIDF